MKSILPVSLVSLFCVSVFTVHSDILVVNVKNHCTMLLRSMIMMLIVSMARRQACAMPVLPRTFLLILLLSSTNPQAYDLTERTLSARKHHLGPQSKVLWLFQESLLVHSVIGSTKLMLHEKLLLWLKQCRSCFLGQVPLLSPGRSLQALQKQKMKAYNVFRWSEQR